MKNTPALTIYSFDSDSTMLVTFLNPQLAWLLFRKSKKEFFILRQLKRYWYVSTKIVTN